jgi:putative transposase
LKGIYSQVLQEVVKRVDLAYQAFFRRVKDGEDPGYPRFKGRDRYDSFTYTQSGFSLKPGKLWLSKIGEIKIKLHRAIDGEIQRLNLRRMPTGKWVVSFLVEVEPDDPPPKTGLSTGVDVGLKSFITLSNGEHVDNPRFFVHEEKALAKAQRKLSRVEKGSPERAKALKVVHRVHERITNKRDDFVQKLSLKLVESYDLIAFEDLNIRGMVKNHCLAKHIADAAWNKLIITTSYKAEWAGKRVELVNPNRTSQICSGCGQVVQKDLSERVHSCSFCGLILDRDHNAAINILRLGLQSVAKA